MTAAGRFEVYVNDELTGFAEYHLFAGEMALLHTEVAARVEGGGFGGELIRGLLDHARDHRRTVLPYCPFIRGWIWNHPDYLDLVPEEQRVRFDL